MKLIGNNDEKKYEVGNFSEELNRIAGNIIVKERNASLEPRFLKLNIVSSDYIQIPGQDFVMAIAETNQGLNYYHAHKKTIGLGLMIPKSNQFMKFYNYFHDCYKNNKPIFDAAGNAISKNTRKNLYEELTKNCWTWLNGEFNINETEKTIEYIQGIDINENFIKKKFELKSCVMGECFIGPSNLNEQGFPKRDPNLAGFKNKEDIYYFPPMDSMVGTFDADSNKVYLSCSKYSFDMSSNLGVRAIKDLINLENIVITNWGIDKLK